MYMSKKFNRITHYESKSHLYYGSGSITHIIGYQSKVWQRGEGVVLYIISGWYKVEQDLCF